MKGLLMTAENGVKTSKGLKTQTRRVESSLREINKNPDDYDLVEMCKTTPEGWQTMGHSGIWTDNADTGGILIKPRYSLNEIVYLKEAHYSFGYYEKTDIWLPKSEMYKARFKRESDTIYFEDTIPPEVDLRGGYDGICDISMWYHRSPLFLPEEYARTFLKITGVDLQRLQMITIQDIIAEGIAPCSDSLNWVDDTRHCFIKLWNSINEKPKYSKKDDCYYSYPWDGQEVREYRGKVWYVCGNPYVVKYDYKLEER